MDSIGLAVGIAVGLACGIAIGRMQKPWSEMTRTERRLMIGATVAGVVTFLAGIGVFLMIALQ